jgi:hypothetical protein
MKIPPRQTGSPGPASTIFATMHTLELRISKGLIRQIRLIVAGTDYFQVIGLIIDALDGVWAWSAGAFEVAALGLTIMRMTNCSLA